MDDKTDKITFKFIFPEDYNPVFANGVHGEITPRGEIIMHFVQERRPIPKSITHSVGEDGRLGPETHRKPESVQSLVIKYVTTGVTLSYTEARSVHAWLGNMLDHFERSAGISRSSDRDANKGGDDHEPGSFHE
jgi:hypothetical protein